MDFYTSVEKKGNKILYRGIENGHRVNKRIDMQPCIYTSTTRESDIKSLSGTPLIKLQYESINKANQIIDDMKGISNFQICGQTEWNLQYISEKFGYEDIAFDIRNIKIYEFDIETKVPDGGGFPNADVANEEIQLITVKDFKSKKSITFGTSPYTGNQDISFYYYDSEEKMLRAFLNFWKRDYPDVVTGWNSFGFDFKYLYNRYTKIFSEKVANEFSPWGIIKPEERTFKNITSSGFKIKGVAQLDYLHLYKQHVQNKKEMYTLDFIASIEIGAQKLENPDPEDSFKNFYEKYWNTFVEYNVRDVSLIDDLDAKKGFIKLQISLAYLAGVNYEDITSPIRMWDSIINRYLTSNNIIPPALNDKEEKTKKYSGGFVKAPLTGHHKWVASFDLDSLYPHLIMQYNLSPDTITDEKLDLDFDKLLAKQEDTSRAKQLGFSLAASGWMTRKDKKGFLVELMFNLYNKRKKIKQEMLRLEREYEKTHDESLLNQISLHHVHQWALKIALNAAYGALGNANFRYYDLRLADSITTSGRLSVQWMQNHINEWMNKQFNTKDEDYVVYGDTDSIYVTLEKFIENKENKNKTTLEKIDIMDDICENMIEPVIDQGYKELAEYMNAYEQKMHMKREVLADAGIWVAKKRYILRVYNSEGTPHNPPELKILGLDMIKSSTPRKLRNVMKQSLPFFLDKDEEGFHKFMSDFNKEFFAYPLEEVSSPKGVNDIEKWIEPEQNGTNSCKKGTPFHVKASVAYNNSLTKFGLENKYKKISSGDSVKLVPLYEPNPLGVPVVAYLDKVPEEFQIEKYVDYGTQFYKAFEKPVEGICEVMNWKTKETMTLDF